MKTARDRRHELIARMYVQRGHCDYVVNAPGGGLLACQGPSTEQHRHVTYRGLKRRPHARWRRLEIAP